MSAKRRHRLGALAVLLGGLLALTVSRCDRRQPGVAAPVAAPVPLAAGAVRRDVRFPCGDSQCAAWLFLPAAAPARLPVVVMAHGFAGTRGVGLPFFAERVVGAGLAALVFDYRHFGASGGLPRQVVDPWRQLEDWRAALAWVRQQPELDGDRIALWGSSLGAGHALMTAAEDAHVAAVVAQAPMIDTQLEGDAAPSGVGWAIRVLLSGWADFIASAYGAEPLALAAIAPSAGFGMIVDDRAHAAAQRIVDVEGTYRNAVAARSVFLFDDYNPAARVDAIRAPVLLIASRTDRFAPFAAVQAYAARAPGVSVATYEGDHFDVYLSPAREVAAAAAVEFLTHQLHGG